MRRAGFPEDFAVQRIGVSAALTLAKLPPQKIAEYLFEHPDICEALLNESYDKRFSPSTFIMEEGQKFRVGWYTRDAGYQCVNEFSSLYDAATDYLLLSLGIGRWTTTDRR